MKRESASKAAERAERRALVKALIDAGLWECQVGLTLSRASFILSTTSAEDRALSVARVSCHMTIEGLHERRKRSAGGSLTLLTNLMPSCNPCNGWIEDHPQLAHRLGLVVREGDDDWFLCGGDRGGF